MIQNVGNFTVVDLFAGCGGLSEGFRQAGFEIIGQVEMNRFACQTLRTRLLYHYLKKIDMSGLYHQYLRNEIRLDELFTKNGTMLEIKEEIQRRVHEVELEEEGIGKTVYRLMSAAKHAGLSRVNVILGGPPCQPYALIGRARDPQNKINDERHYLYRYYLKIIEFLEPDFFVYENVPGIISARNIKEDIFKALIEDFSSLTPPYHIIPGTKQYRNYSSFYFLNSADFGVPQIRKRFFLIGCKKSILKKVPEIRDIYSSFLKQAFLNRQNNGYLTVSDAIGDLPSLNPGEGDDNWYGPYNDSSITSSYQNEMRMDSPGIINHKARQHMESDLRRYSFFIKQFTENGSANLNTLKKKRPDLLPEHRNLEHFTDRFRVQVWDKPASTITAHISKDGHYFIHPDIKQCRSFTAREAARCQSFMDNYKFEGSRTQQFIQIGNAVPPLLGRAIARGLLKMLRKIYNEQK